MFTCHTEFKGAETEKKKQHKILTKVGVFIYQNASSVRKKLLNNLERWYSFTALQVFAILLVQVTLPLPMKCRQNVKSVVFLQVVLTQRDCAMLLTVILPDLKIVQTPA